MWSDRKWLITDTYNLIKWHGLWEMRGGREAILLLESSMVASKAKNTLIVYKSGDVCFFWTNFLSAWMRGGALQGAGQQLRGRITRTRKWTTAIINFSGSNLNLGIPCTLKTQDDVRKMQGGKLRTLKSRPNTEWSKKKKKWKLKLPSKKQWSRNWSEKLWHWPKKCPRNTNCSTFSLDRLCKFAIKIYQMSELFRGCIDVISDMLTITVSHSGVYISTKWHQKTLTP